jgi:molecular chaperone DnaK
MASYNKTLGKFQLVDLPPAPRGVPQIEVTFDIDANGIVHVSAKDRATSKEQSMTISGQSTLAKDDIDRMVRDAETHAEEDKRKREEAETRNSADSLVWQTESLLKDQGDKVPAEDRQKIDDALKALKDALAGTDVDAVKRAHEALLTASNDFTRRLYENVQAQQSAASADSGAGAGAGAGAQQPSDDEVADAEIIDDDQQSA